MTLVVIKIDKWFRKNFESILLMFEKMKKIVPDWPRAIMITWPFEEIISSASSSFSSSSMFIIIFIFNNYSLLLCQWLGGLFKTIRFSFLFSLFPILWPVFLLLMLIIMTKFVVVLWIGGFASIVFSCAQFKKINTTCTEKDSIPIIFIHYTCNVHLLK